MPTNHELQDDVTQMQTTLYGAHGQGGLVRDVEQVRTRVDDHEKKLNVLSFKWLILMLLAGALGNSVGTSVLAPLVKTLLQ